MVCGPEPIRYHVQRTIQCVTVSETRMGQARYTDFMTLPSVLESLVARGLRGVEFIVSDDHSGLRAARRAVPRRLVLGGATWQRCRSSGKQRPTLFSDPPHHLARNAIHHAPNAEIRKRVGRQLKSIWTADDLAKAETALAALVASYRDTASKLADRLEAECPRGACRLHAARAPPKALAHVQPDRAFRPAGTETAHRQGQGVSQRGCPPASRQRRLVEIDEKWASETEAYIKWECQDA